MSTVVVEEEKYYAAAPEAIWPAIANSDLAGETSDPGRYEAVDELQADGSVIRRAKGDKFGIAMKRWREDLGEWVVPNYCRQFRQGEEGMAEHADFEAHINAEGEGSRVHVRAEMKIPGTIGWLADKGGFVRRATTPIVENFFQLIDSQLMTVRDGDGDPMVNLNFAPPPLSESAQRQLGEKCQSLRTNGHDPALVAKLSDYLAQAPESFLHRIRPLALAADWQQSPEAVVDICLGAHGAGLLSLQWNVLCPRCRNTRTPQSDLQDLPESLHCSTCNVDYEREFSHNVELTFSPEPWLREMPVGQACLMGQASVPHILVQRHVAAGSELVVHPALTGGTYRLRTAQAGDELEVDWDGASSFPSVIAADGRIATGGPQAGGGILLKNQENRDLTFVVEELSWRRDALTGDQVIASAAFRRHCPEQLLRPGDDVAIANVVLMFTDLKSSTSLYEAIGDAAAYNLVRDHFDYLNQFVEQYNGTLVKTMGDAIMAAFSSGEEAFAAALQAQDGIASFNRGREDGGIVLKVGLHQGACIAVASNGIMDYFGSTVNLASRLQAESQGGDIVISEALNDLLAAPPEELGLENYQISHESGHLRGIEEPVDYCRLTMRI